MKHNEIIVDSFAGGGGASLGIKRAVGREPDIAINHDPAAIAMHAANHPGTRHYTEDVWKVQPYEVMQGRHVGLFWASPDCKHFSRAKGAKPVEKNIRSLAWVVVKWAVEGQPRVIMLENVREFEEWGPLVPQWRCCDCTWKGTEGQAKLVRRRRACPACEAKRLKQTTDMVPDPARKGLTFRRWVGRLRSAGYKVDWRVLNAADYGAPTHRRRLFLVGRRDGRGIFWPDPTHGDPKKIVPTLFNILKPWRTAAECIDWSIPCPSIFGRKRPLVKNSMRRIAYGVKCFVLENPSPFIVRIGQTGWTQQAHYSIHSPLTTIVSKNEHLLVSPTLIGTGGPARAGEPRSANAPLNTIMRKSNTALVAAFLAKHFGGVIGVPINTPLPTTTTRGTQNQLVAANLVHLNHGEKQWSGCDEPLRTVTTTNHAALVYAFLVKYFGTAIGQMVDIPLHTATGKARFGVVMVTVAGETYIIMDIGMRMLTPRELARCQGFPDDYILTGTKTSQVERIGNSVSPYPAEALVKANL